MNQLFVRAKTIKAGDQEKNKYADSDDDNIESDWELKDKP